MKMEDPMKDFEHFLRSYDELNYEYDELDHQSRCSTPKSDFFNTDRLSPVDLSNFDDLEEEETPKKLRRDFVVVEGKQKRPYLKKRWKYDINKAGLKKWHIRALDYLFLVQPSMAETPPTEPPLQQKRKNKMFIDCTEKRKNKMFIDCTEKRKNEMFIDCTDNEKVYESIECDDKRTLELCEKNIEPPLTEPSFKQKKIKKNYINHRENDKVYESTICDEKLCEENIEDIQIIIKNDLCTNPMIEPKVCISTESITELHNQVQKFKKHGICVQ